MGSVEGRTAALSADPGDGIAAEIEAHSIDVIPESERRGRVHSQCPAWILIQSWKRRPSWRSPAPPASPATTVTMPATDPRPGPPDARRCPRRSARCTWASATQATRLGSG